MNNTPKKRVSVFIDGQNLFWAVKEAFDYTYPNYDIRKLVEAICLPNDWSIGSIRFYTGIPSELDNEKWNRFWQKKCLSMSRDGITVFTRQLRYRNKAFYLEDGSRHSILVGSEKGVDVRIALDIIKGVLNDEFDVCLIFSQDQDLSEVVKESKEILSREERLVEIKCAFPYSPTTTNKRGIDGTDWIKITRILYDSCIDNYDYFE